VAIIEYADFDCPSCAQFAQGTERVLLREYVDKGRVVVVFKHFPLPSHPGAQAAAQAAWCAARQEKFWEMHDALFRIRGGLQDSDLQAAAKEIGVDLALYNSCRAADEAGQHVQTDRAEGERLKVPGTPTFFVGRVTVDQRVQVTDAVVGSKSVEELKTILDRLLSK
jgi:protein-disulfide isomerase